MCLGFVTIAGAGPGDADMLTLGVWRRLRDADVVLHDQLVDESVLALLPPDVRRVAVGKVGGGRSTDQRWIEARLIEEAQQGHRVVRLKGGDPFLFGRGGEEALALVRAGVPFEVLPGVSSALAVPLHAGIPVTHRGVSTHVSVVTAVAGGDDDALRATWRTLSSAGGTLVFLMGLRRIDEIASEVRAGGRSGQEPVAVISRGGTEDEQVVEGTLDTIAQRVREARLPAPALIVIGEVVALRGQLREPWLALAASMGAPLSHPEVPIQVA